MIKEITMRLGSLEDFAAPWTRTCASSTASKETAAPRSHGHTIISPVIPSSIGLTATPEALSELPGGLVWTSSEVERC